MRGSLGTTMQNTPVLIVDDSASTANIITALFRMCGFTDVDQAASAEHALGMMGRRRYGLVLCDMYMTGQDGLQLLATVRNDPVLSDTCFLLMHQDVDARDIGERSDAVLRTAMPGHDGARGMFCARPSHRPAALTVSAIGLH